MGTAPGEVVLPQQILSGGFLPISADRYRYTAHFMSEMKLQLGNGRVIRRPSVQQIKVGLRSAGDTGGFVILRRDKQNYIQAAGSQDEGFYLEYRSGGPDQHYRSTSNSIPYESAIEVFKGYAARNQHWWHMVEWEKERSLATAISHWSGWLAGCGYALMGGWLLFDWISPNLTNQFAKFVGLDRITLLVYALAIGLLACYPWAWQYVSKDPPTEEITMAGARITIFGAPFCIIMGVIFTLQSCN